MLASRPCRGLPRCAGDCHGPCRRPALARRARRALGRKQIASDIGKMPSEAHKSPSQYHDWVSEERQKLRIDDAVCEWGGKNLLYHIKARPHRFLNCTRLMSQRVQNDGAKAFALYPLRRTNVPRHVRFDEVALRSVRAIAPNLRVECAIARRWRAPGGRYATSSPLELGQGDLNLGHATTAQKSGASSMRCTNVRFVLTAAQATTMQWEREACAPALTHGGGPWYRGHHTGPLNAPVARARRAVHSVC